MDIFGLPLANNLRLSASAWGLKVNLHTTLFGRGGSTFHLYDAKCWRYSSSESLQYLEKLGLSSQSPYKLLSNYMLTLCIIRTN